MACKKYIYAAGDTTWVTTFMAGIEASWKGINNTILTNWNTTTVCAIDDGSLFEVAGALYVATTDTSITGSVATGINYIEAVGSATGCIFKWTQDIPVWRNDLNGWYASAASTSRDVGGCFFDGSSYCAKYLYRDYDNPVKWWAAVHGGFVSDTVNILQGSDGYVTWANSGYLLHAIQIPDNSYITKIRARGLLSTGTTFALKLWETTTVATGIAHYVVGTTTQGVFDINDDITTTNCNVDYEHGSYRLVANFTPFGSGTSAIYYMGCQYIQRSHQ